MNTATAEQLLKMKEMELKKLEIEAGLRKLEIEAELRKLEIEKEVQLKKLEIEARKLEIEAERDNPSALWSSYYINHRYLLLSAWQCTIF